MGKVIKKDLNSLFIKYDDIIYNDVNSEEGDTIKRNHARDEYKIAVFKYNNQKYTCHYAFFPTAGLATDFKISLITSALSLPSILAAILRIILCVITYSNCAITSAGTT